MTEHQITLSAAEIAMVVAALDHAADHLAEGARAASRLNVAFENLYEREMRGLAQKLRAA
jgi:hypothetical protein